MLLLLATLALAQDDAPPPFDPDAAEDLPDLSREQLRWLRPNRSRLGVAPRSQIDFTAYTLEMGEVRVGVTSLSLGLLPRMQVGTSAVLDILGVYNGTWKFDAVRVGPVDVAVLGTIYALPLGDFYGQLSKAGLVTSVMLHERVSVHVEGDYAYVEFSGVPDLGEVSPLLLRLSGAAADDWELDPNGVLEGARPRFAGDAVRVEGAVDLRLNRRDSFILRGTAVAWARARGEWGGVELPPIAGLDQVFSTGGAAVPLASSYVVSLAYQASWKQVDLRVGAGVSAVSWAWALQTVEIAYRFGGESRQREREMWEGWRRSREDLEEPADDG